MSNDVTEWLAQIKALRQQLTDSINSRQAADESAANWRRLYNTEAQQRRTQMRLAQQQIETLQAQIQQLQGERTQLTSDSLPGNSAIEYEVAQIQSIEELRTKLIEVILEREGLTKALKAEQNQHAQTRKNLTAVIGDTIEQLSKNSGSSQINKKISNKLN
ncbi:MAG: hypothetical protein F6K58_04310 [Symploca sp. SIO2E9]|nr:hypothetical protein [Symploca sp. SIO2E9]